MLLVCAVDLVKFGLELLVVVKRDVKVVVEFLKDLKFELMEMGDVDSASKLKGLVVVVEVVLEFGGEEEGGEHGFVDVEIIEAEVFHGHVVAVDEDDGDDEALCGEVGVFVQPAQKLRQRDRGHWCWVEDGLARRTLLLDEVAQQVRRQQNELL